MQMNCVVIVGSCRWLVKSLSWLIVSQRGTYVYLDPPTKSEENNLVMGDGETWYGIPQLAGGIKELGCCVHLSLPQCLLTLHVSCKRDANCQCGGWFGIAQCCERARYGPFSHTFSTVHTHGSIRWRSWICVCFMAALGADFFFCSLFVPSDLFTMHRRV